MAVVVVVVVVGCRRMDHGDRVAHEVSGPLGGAPEDLVSALAALSHTQVEQGALDDARAGTATALALAETSGADRALAEAISAGAWIDTNAGDLDRALPAYLSAHDLVRARRP